MRVFVFLLLLFVAFSRLNFSDNLLPNQCCREKLEQSDWVLFVKRFGDEKILTKFPNEPVIEHFQDNSDIAFISASAGEISYYLIGFSKDLIEDKTDIGEIVQDQLKFIEKEIGVISLIQVDSFSDEKGDILDFICKIERKPYFYRIRILTTLQNVYIFLTKLIEDKKDMHQFFISSFEYVS